MNLNYKYHEYIDEYIKFVRNPKNIVSEDIVLAMDLVERKLSDKKVFIDSEKIYRSVELMEEYFEMKFIPWERFITACIHCYYMPEDILVFDTIFLMIGRGNGKNGFISALSWYLTTHEHGISEYNVDIIANSQDQAETSFNDVYNMLEKNWNKLKRGFDKTKTLITSKKTNSEIKFNTSNARTKDGKRSACLIFDEIHEYESSKIINVFLGGFGKKKHSRTFYITTNGYVRGGILDKELDKMESILKNINGMGDILRTLPLLYRVKSEKEIEKESNWIKANPSFPYFPDLQLEIKKHWIDGQFDIERKLDFYTKRMNYPKKDARGEVAEWKYIKAASLKDIPFDVLCGAECIGAIDYAQVHDFCSVGLLFKYKGTRYWYEHTFIQKDTLNIPSREFKFPIMEMVEKGLITIIETPTIRAETIADWFSIKVTKYHIKRINADSYRYDYLIEEFEKRGLLLEKVRSGPITHTLLAPTITSMFREKTIVWGDNPTMNWYTNNTAVQIDKKGNTTYIKQEPILRKTDGFFALIHALVSEGEIRDKGIEVPLLEIGVRTY